MVNFIAVQHLEDEPQAEERGRPFYIRGAAEMGAEHPGRMVR
jgi:hypothetical protein